MAKQFHLIMNCKLDMIIIILIIVLRAKGNFNFSKAGSACTPHHTEGARMRHCSYCQLVRIGRNEGKSEQKPGDESKAIQSNPSLIGARCQCSLSRLW